MATIVRKFNVSVAILLEFTGVIIKHLSEDLPSFTAYDPDLNNEKYLKLKALYESARIFGSDKLQVGNVGELTEKLTEELNHCKSLVKDVRYFAKKKFEKNSALFKQFKFDNYLKVVNNQPKMVAYMHELAATVEKHKTELQEAGLKDAVIESIKPAATAYERSNVNQKNEKGNRLLTTEERTVLLNSIYDILADFSKAAKNVFEKNRLKRKRYVLPHNNKKRGGDNNGQEPGL